MEKLRTVCTSRSARLASATAVSAFMLVACGSDAADTAQDTTSAPTTTAEASTTPATAGTTENETPTETAGECASVGEAAVLATAECIDGEWPLTVDSGELYCTGPDAVAIRVEGQGVFAVNGMASSAIEGVQDIEPIWKDNPELEGTKVSIAPLIDLGLSLCE